MREACSAFIPLGAIIGWFYDRWGRRSANPVLAERLGILAATGLIAGESLFGVAFAGIAAASGSPTPLAVVGENRYALPVGMVVYGLVIAWLYLKVRRAAQTT